MFLGSAGTADGVTIYSREMNPLLEQGVTATTDLVGHKITQPLNNSEYATKAATQAFARALSADVMELGSFGTAVSSVPKRFLLLPGGGAVAAGAIASVMGNDAAYPSMNVKSGAIAELLGVPYHAGIAEALFAAVEKL